MPSPLLKVVVVIAVTAAAACGATAGTRPGATPPPRASAPDPVARADSLRHSYTPADVAFMKGMIQHHAQALVMSRMAPTHGASEVLQVLAARIINSQLDEIALMQAWLRDRGEAVPEPHGMDMATTHPGDPMTHMPGMLSEEQLAELDAAHGPEFDSLFLVYMIQHHQGALTMVNDLFDTYGAAQGDAIFKLASDIGADQTSEIDRMQKMLHELMFEPTGSP